MQEPYFDKSFKQIKTILIFERQIIVENCTDGVVPTVSINEIMDVKKEIIESKKIYSEEWEFTSEFYHENDYYTLLASKLPKNIDTLLEVGSGLGFSTLAISEKADKIIAIEENNFCVEKTHSLLTDYGKKSIKTLRGTINTKFNSIQDFSYQMNYDSLTLNYNDTIHCLEGNILTDSFLFEALERLNKSTDVVTCWMIGAHGLILNEEQQQQKGRNSVTRTPEMLQGYKFDVLEQTAKAASSLLRNKGILSIVERINLQYLDDFSEEQILNLYNERIMQYGFKLKNEFDVTVINSINKMHMVSTEGTIQPTELGLLYMEYELNA